MYSTELEALNSLVERAQYVSTEGHPRGLDALQKLEAELVAELGWVAPAHHATSDYRRGILALEELRKAITAEKLLNPDPDDTNS
jgi:hypothetical protein